MKALTLIELLVSVLVVAVLATLGIANYQASVDRANMLVDETNQQIVQMAVMLFTADHDALPASISELRDEHLRRPYAQASPRALSREPSPSLWWGVAVAEAATGTLYPKYVSDQAVLTCRTSKVLPSYMIDPFFASMSRQEFEAAIKNPENAGRPLIREVEYWHKSRLFGSGDLAVATTCLGEAVRIRSGGTVIKSRPGRERTSPHRGRRE